MTWTDGSTTGRLDARPPLVTGPNTLVQVVGPVVKGGARPIQVYPLNPQACYREVRYAGGYIPPEVTALTTARFPGAALHVNINPDACDDLVWVLMRRIRDHFPAGRHGHRRVPQRALEFRVQLLSATARWRPTTLGYENPYTLSYYMRRSAECGTIARAAFKETGREAEIKLMLNCQLGSDQPKIT